MKKLLSLTVLGLSLFTLAACGKSSSKTETKGSLDNEASKILTVKHEMFARTLIRLPWQMLLRNFQEAQILIA